MILEPVLMVNKTIDPAIVVAAELYLNRQNLHKKFGFGLWKYVDVGLTYNPVGKLAAVIGDN
ncbi:hypothetical protein SY94_3654 [Agrobacterium tumefaciens]|nr:hypothetical protein SY94_3654 [Agrobacterium tumefaciens]